MGKLHPELRTAVILAEAHDPGERLLIFVAVEAEAIGRDAPAWLDTGRLGDDQADI